MEDAVIVSAVRTPVGTFGGVFADVPATRLGAIAIEEALRRAGIDSVDEVLMGNVLQAGLGQNTARQSAIGAGLSDSVPSTTVNKVCGSGLKAVALAAQAIRAGDAECIVAGGMESMSRAPFLLTGAREGWKFGNQQVLDSMQHDGLWCAFEDMPMGAEADYIAARRGVSRHDQDLFAVESHRRAVTAAAAGRFAREIVPVVTSGRKGEVRIDMDEGPRADTSLDVLARLKPSFGADGTVTAGNASQISDGAAALVVANAEIARTCRSPV